MQDLLSKLKQAGHVDERDIKRHERQLIIQHESDRKEREFKAREKERKKRRREKAAYELYKEAMRVKIEHEALYMLLGGK